MPLQSFTTICYYWESLAIQLQDTSLCDTSTYNTKNIY